MAALRSATSLLAWPCSHASASASLTFTVLGIEAATATDTAFSGELEVDVLVGAVVVYVSLLGPGLGSGVVVGVVDLATCGGSSISYSCFHHFCHKYITSNII